MRALTENMTFALHRVAAWEFMGRTSTDAKHAVDGNAWNALSKRGLFGTREDGRVHEYAFLTPAAWDMVDQAEVLNIVRKQIKNLARDAELLQKKLARTQDRLTTAIEAGVNSGHDVVEVEVTLCDRYEVPQRPRKVTFVVPSETDDKSLAFKINAADRAFRSLGSWTTDRHGIDVANGFEVDVVARWTFGPVRS